VSKNNKSITTNQKNKNELWLGADLHIRLMNSATQTIATEVSSRQKPIFTAPTNRSPEPMIIMHEPPVTKTHKLWPFIKGL
jgi:hypothetical protein